MNNEKLNDATTSVGATVKKTWYKKIAWGILALACLLGIGGITGCGGDGEKEAICREYLEEKYGKGSVQEFRMGEVKEAEGGASAVVAFVSINTPEMSAKGDAVFYVMEHDGDLAVAGFEFEQ